MSDAIIPDYVKTVIEEFETAEIHLISRSSFPLPPRTSPIVISVIKDERDRLEDFLRHYRDAGIERFIFVDNGSADGSVEFLRLQRDVDLYEKRGPFNWMLKQGWISRMVASYGYDRWYMYLDADEHIVFDGIGDHGFSELTAAMEAQGLWRVRGFLVDMYSHGPFLNSDYVAGGRLLESYPLLDRDTYQEARYKEIMSVKGGPRMRVFGTSDGKFRPELSKYPLFRTTPGEFMANPHHIWPYGKNFESPRYLAILHFKFLPDIVNRIKRAIEAKNYWGGSFEYQCYFRVVETNPGVSLAGSDSIAFEGADDLVARQLIAPIPWPQRRSLTSIMRASYRERRRELLTGRPTPHAKCSVHEKG